MNREELKALGLSDEQIEKVMTAHGKVVNDTKKKADEVDGLKTQIDDYKEQLKDRDKQLKDLGEKAKGNEELTAEIDQLKQANEDAQTEYENKLAAQQKDFAIESALRDAKAINPKVAKKAFSDDELEAVTLKDGKLIGFDGLLKTAKENEAYLFEQVQQQTPPTIVNPGNPNGGGSNTPKNIADMTYQELADLKTNNPAQFEQLTKN